MVTGLEGKSLAVNEDGYTQYLELSGVNAYAFYNSEGKKGASEQLWAMLIQPFATVKALYVVIVMLTGSSLGINNIPLVRTQGCPILMTLKTNQLSYG